MADGEWYTVRKGDCLSSIGEERNVPWKKIWRASENSELRRKRGNPNVLYPGDRVFVPALESKDDSGATQQRHTYRRPGGLELRVKVLDYRHKPSPDIEYRFTVDGELAASGKTDAEGIAHGTAGRRAQHVVLHLPWGDFPVMLGALDPAHTIRGIQQRLRNLGIDPGPIDGLIGPKTRRGIQEFQEVEADAGLDATGQPDRKTIRRLRELHDQETLPQEDLEEHPREPDTSDGAGEQDAQTSLADTMFGDEPVEADELLDFTPGWDHVPESESEAGSASASDDDQSAG